MTTLQNLLSEYGNDDILRDIYRAEQLRNALKEVSIDEIKTAEDGKEYIKLVKKLRDFLAKTDELKGANFPQLIKNILSVGEDGLYSNNLRFIFELIQNVDDCEYSDPTSCKLDMRFDFEKDEIILTYNEKGFIPLDVFAITGIAEAVKNISSDKLQIGEKGIGFKSVFGVADKVWIKSGWFSFELHTDHFTIPIPVYDNFNYCEGTEMTLYVPGRAKQIYEEINRRYCKNERKEALFSQNPVLFLNKLTSLKFYVDTFRSMEFHVPRTENKNAEQFFVEKDIKISVDLRDGKIESEDTFKDEIPCTRYTYSVNFSKEACRARYGSETKVGQENGRDMKLIAVIPDLDTISSSKINKGALYSFLPTKIEMTAPILCHVPFKLDASREYVDSQGSSRWFKEAIRYLSELLDQVYLDYSRIVKENIIYYLPDKRVNLFTQRVNNDKVDVLTKHDRFNGTHFLDLPIFHTVDDTFKKADEIFCFDIDEKITDHRKIYQFIDLGDQLSLFIAPDSVDRFKIKTVKDVKPKIFKSAFTSPDKTSDILDYLDSENYDYPEQLVLQFERELKSIDFTKIQIQTIILHQKLLKVLQKISCDAIKKNEISRLTIADSDDQLTDISDCLFDDFEMTDIPESAKRYMDNCHEKCTIIDCPNEIYLPCSNGIVISGQKPFESFISFCSNIAPNDPFITRITWREKSNELNKYMEDSTISEKEYLRILRQIRLSIRDSLGKEGYQSYIEIIIRTGKENTGRFIPELLQNADDCIYSQDITPTFSLSSEGNKIITEYNEIGFTRANIRAITAIGESTKNKLLTNQSKFIGEKGVGFKSIFAVASKVTIHSGKYHISLTDKEPTIPLVQDETGTETVPGTRMEIMLKNREILSDYREKDILELCLCLRNLKKLNIGKHSVIISDTDDKRTITLGKKDYVFKRFIHNFTITDENALKERENNKRQITPNQQIVCYVPEFSQSEFPLYCGLPTKHMIKIPMAIDAPFSLITSREEILAEGSVWNDIIRREMYAAIMNVILSLKIQDRSNVFRFLRVIPQRHGLEMVYVDELFDSHRYLNGYDLLSQIRSKEILPTYQNDFFAVPDEHKAYRFPKSVIYLLNKISSSEYEGIDASTIIDERIGDYEKVLNALNCKDAPFSMVFPIISKYAERYITEEDFRNSLYEDLKKIPNEYLERIKKLKIIPVYSKGYHSTVYISWEESDIFVKPNAFRSEDDYYVLNESLMPKSVCEEIYSANINEMNDRMEHNRYNDNLEDKIRDTDDISSLYNYLMTEYRLGKLQKNDSFGRLSTLVNEKKIPLKNQLGDITCDNLFVCDKSIYFTTKMIKSITVHDECKGLANDINIKSLRDIHFDDIHYSEKLTEEEIEDLVYVEPDYFKNWEEILYRFHQRSLLSDELLNYYDLEYFTIQRLDDNYNKYDFPSEQVGNRELLNYHISKLWNSPAKILSVEEKRQVRKIRNKDGKLLDLNSNDAREETITRYSPYGEPNLCFCQMCGKLKDKKFIEVNNLELEPEYYFPQLRVALCLECSKHFESLRKNTSIRQRYFDSIKKTHITFEGKIPIKIYDNNSLTFTAKHLAEIQEILKQSPDNKK